MFRILEITRNVSYVMNSITKKVCILGTLDVTGTSLVRRFAHTLFDDKYISTIGVKISRKTVNVAESDETVKLTMILWELTNLAAFSQLRVSYLRGTAGAVLVCDLMQPQTLDKLYVYATEVMSINPGARLIIAANQPVSGDKQSSEIQLQAIAADLNVPYQLISVENGTGVEALFVHLGQLLAD